MAEGWQTPDPFRAERWDRVVGPAFPAGTRRLHWGFDDPSQASGTEPERLAVFRRVRDEIVARLEAWLADREVRADPGSAPRR